MAPVLACPEHLEQVAVILLNNARQALAGQHPPAEVLAEVFQQGSNLVIRISDNGPGIPEEHLERIFDPFFTTKPVGEGTGLGLSLCQRLVKEHGGELRAQNRSEGGAVFTVVLPSFDSTRELAAPKPETPAPDPGQELKPRILFADDEDNIRRLVVRYFSRRGYDIVAVSNGAEAVAAFQNDPEKFELVILDLVMPIMPGKDAFIKIRAIRPEVPVLISSGSVSGDSVSMIETDDHTYVLEKPYKPAELVRMVQSIAIAAQSARAVPDR